MNALSALDASAPARAETPSLVRGWALFLREALSDPRSIGAVLPSSPALAQRMAGAARPEPDSVVVELGAGTGVVTKALLAYGVNASQLLAVERSEALSDLLREQFPGIRIVCGDAADLRNMVRRTFGRPSAVHVVSSLPLRSLPPDKVRRILREIAGVLRRGGRWVQYTYALGRRQVPRGFARAASSFVWQNIPPARIDVFTSARGSQ